MNKISTLVGFASALVVAASLQATPQVPIPPNLTIAGASTGALGRSITKSDNNYSNSTFANDVQNPQNGIGGYGNHEDAETENNPNTYTTQNWDLEGMYLKGTQLSLVGGFNFWNGETSGGICYNSGDIFIDTTGNAKYGSTGANKNLDPKTGPQNIGGIGPNYGTENTTNCDGWDYVIHFNSTVSSYTVYKLYSDSIVTRVLDVPSSNPWTFAGNVAGQHATQIGGTYNLLGAGSFTGNNLTTYGSPPTGGLLGGTHNYLSVDISFLPVGSVATFHYTVECGNDDLIGKATRTNVPEGASTALMIGGALMGLMGLRRKLRA
ncbi:MAG: hypothetical protein JWM32_543 [Verrucomicrobia bacterium]|nr:hypothetical protein [Verrucomicrobiota bacterium]